MPQKLKRVIRLDSQPLDKAFFTPEGYLKDRPVLTSTGIFEYSNDDGSVRRELRLPEEVFDKKSLESYKGKPIIVTHDAGLITKVNVTENQIGTILSDGYQDGDDVKAEIIIHDTDEMKQSGLRELSLGYNLDLDETPGVWEGEPYDAIQRNIRINHLALVREARAGEQAHLNIDGKDANVGYKKFKGGNTMSKKVTRKKAARADGVLSPEELKKAIAEYKARRAKTDGDDEPANTPQKKAAQTPVPKKAAPKAAIIADDDEGKEVGVAGGDTTDIKKQVELMKDRRDRRDAEGEPEDIDEANERIANQDDDMDKLYDIIDSLLAMTDFAQDGEDDEESDIDNGDCDDTTNEDGDEDEEDLNADEDDEEVALGAEEDVNEDDGEDEDDINEDDDEDDEFAEDDDDEDEAKAPSKLNADSVDKIVRERVQIGKVASMLNMDGLEFIKPMKAKKTIIKAVKPGVRLDGKSKAYIDAMFELSCNEIQKRSRKDTMYQRKQMFNKDSKQSRREDSTDAARRRMIKRMQKTK